MSITDELLEYADTIAEIDPVIGGNLKAIASSIDEEYEKLLEEMGNTCYFYDEEENECKCFKVNGYEEWLAGHGWIRLPVGADGLPIRVGDVIESMSDTPYSFLPAKVVGYHECCGELMPIVENDGEYQANPEFVRRHKPPSIEDVLREFADKFDEMKGYPPDEDGVVAEYAAKLQLRGDEA